MRDTSRSATAAHALILINAAFWFLFALFAALGDLPADLSIGPAKWVMVILALGAALTLGFLVFLLNKRKKAAFYIVVGVLALIVTLSITDEVGVFDLFILIISFAAIVLLVMNRSWYLSSAATKLKEWGT